MNLRENFPGVGTDAPSRVFMKGVGLSLSFFLSDILSLRSSRSKCNPSTINYRRVVVFLRFDLKLRENLECFFVHTHYVFLRWGYVSGVWRGDGQGREGTEWET